MVSRMIDSCTGGEEEKYIMTYELCTYVSIKRQLLKSSCSTKNGFHNTRVGGSRGGGNSAARTLQYISSIRCETLWQLGQHHSAGLFALARLGHLVAIESGLLEFGASTM